MGSKGTNQAWVPVSGPVDLALVELEVLSHYRASCSRYAEVKALTIQKLRGIDRACNAVQISCSFSFMSVCLSHTHPRPSSRWRPSTRKIPTAQQRALDTPYLGLELVARVVRVLGALPAAALRRRRRVHGLVVEPVVVVAVWVGERLEVGLEVGERGFEGCGVQVREVGRGEVGGEGGERGVDGAQARGLGLCGVFGWEWEVGVGRSWGAGRRGLHADVAVEELGWVGGYGGGVGVGVVAIVGGGAGCVGDVRDAGFED